MNWRKKNIKSPLQNPFSPYPNWVDFICKLILNVVPSAAIACSTTDPCQNSGTCADNSDGAATCDCTNTGYTDSTCSTGIIV